MASLSTLPSDLQALWDKGVSPSPEDLKVFCDKVSEAITSSFTEAVSNEPRTVLRMSSIGKPARQLWYETQYKDDPESLDYSLRLKFLYGHMLEELLVLILKMSGHSVEEQQKEHDLEGVKGHQDARVDGVLVDFKSASGRSFAKFKNQRLVGDDPFGYVAQLSAYAHANNDQEAAFIVIDKQSGEVTVMPLHKMEMIDAEDRIKYLKKVLERDTPPNKCYNPVPDGQSGNMKLNTGCSYCRFKFECWEDTNEGNGLRGFQYANGIRYLTEVRKLPNVPEITPGF
tara:strand:- start:518 stop:1372 length:855 start_codon:yes stop_codon:yes gene_type:complete